MSKTHKQIVGKIGEEIAVKYLKEEKKYRINTINYLRPWGEIDNYRAKKRRDSLY